MGTMSKPSLDEILRGSKEPSPGDNSRVRARVAEIVANAQVIATPRRRRGIRTSWVALPLVGMGILALTGGALVVDNALTPNVVVPISYTTDVGRTIECTISIEGGSLFNPGSSALTDQLRNRDWTGVGQLMYERAVHLSEALSTTPGHDLTDVERDQWAWYSAESQLTTLSVPEHLVPEGDHAVSTSDCTGELH